MLSFWQSKYSNYVISKTSTKINQANNCIFRSRKQENKQKHKQTIARLIWLHRKESANIVNIRNLAKTTMKHLQNTNKKSRKTSKLFQCPQTNKRKSYKRVYNNKKNSTNDTNTTGTHRQTDTPTNLPNKFPQFFLKQKSDQSECAKMSGKWRHRDRRDTTSGGHKQFCPQASSILLQKLSSQF